MELGHVATYFHGCRLRERAVRHPLQGTAPLPSPAGVYPAAGAARSSVATRWI